MESSPQIVLDQFDGSHNLSAKEVQSQSETEPVIVDGVQRALQVADKLAQKWEQRNRLEGVTKWFCPLEDPRSRTLFATQKECQTYMTKEFKARIQQTKLEKRPKNEWTPQSILISPKRTAADFALPEHAERVTAASEAAATARKAINGNKETYTSGTLIAMPEAMAIAKVAGLSDHELQTCERVACTHSKRDLYKACKKQLQKRGLPSFQ